MLIKSIGASTKFGGNIKLNLFNLDRQSLINYLIEKNEKPVHASRLLQWIHHQEHNDLDPFKNLPSTFSQKLKQALQDECSLELPKIILERQSIDGTRKWLLQLQDGLTIEMVCIPEPNRNTLCLSSQVGCPIRCSFCATGQQGFKRNLTTAEIIGQLKLANQFFSITNVVFMGMGEPLLNLDNLLPAIRIIRDTFAYGLSKYRVTVSTSGIVPAMNILSDLNPVSLSISLHAPEDELRNSLIPINHQYPLLQLMEACKNYFKNDRRRKLSFGYILIKGINDTPYHAEKLISILKGLHFKVNLIPYNQISDNSSYQPPLPETVLQFQNILADAKIRTIIRKTRGADIEAACGQLAGRLYSKK